MQKKEIKEIIKNKNGEEIAKALQKYFKKRLDPVTDIFGDVIE